MKLEDFLKTSNLQEYTTVFMYSAFSLELYKEDILTAIYKAKYILIFLIYLTLNYFILNQLV
jgi:hypothetical protein